MDRRVLEAIQNYTMPDRTQGKIVLQGQVGESSWTVSPLLAAFEPAVLWRTAIVTGLEESQRRALPGCSPQHIK